MTTLIALIAAALLAGQHPQTPAGMPHAAEAMGFDQNATTHHFRLSPTGGSIEATVKDGGDTATTAAVRGHLQLIAKEFAAGRFDKPAQTHGEMPPGVADMRAGRRHIVYRYEEVPQGGAVRIETKDARSLSAIHAFLRYQITEHRTGDPLSSK